jgi:GH18 family chitinase
VKKAKLIPILSVLCALPAAARFPVIGYYASWSGGADDIPYGKLTHLNYSFAATGADAGLGGVDEGKLRDIVARAHQAGTKVGVAVGGWGADQAFIAMAATAAGRERFTANAVAFCDRLGLDGIDIDWEFPLPSNADAYESLLKTLGTALHQKGKYLSAAVKSHDVYVPDPDVGKNFKSGIFAAVDFLNVMAYDGGGQNHAPYEMAQAEMQYWTVTRGCPRAKVILGMPFYGKELKSDGKEVATAYRDLPYADRQVAQRDNSGAIWYNGAATIEKKARLAASAGGGIMIWEVAQDARDETSLLGVIAKLAATFPDVPLALAPIPRASASAAVLSWILVRDGRSFSVTGRALPVPPAFPALPAR